MMVDNIFIAIMIFSIFLLSVGQPIGRTHFFLEEGKEKCFVEDVAEGIPLTAMYKNYDNPGVKCSVLFKDPKGRSVYNREVTHEKSEGKVTHLVKSSGQHHICIACESAQWFATSQLKWTLSIDMGDSDLNLTDVAKAHHIEDLETVLNVVKNRLTVLTAENDYERLQEETFRDTSEAMNTRVVIISILQIVIMITAVIISIIHLSRYFHAQKLY